ncbi:MAG: glycoside hydrolase family 28 protein [Clostridiales bacterium]|nr:glycoside hydrolase family 28 protein [Clostridiales bacterium]
MIYNIKDFGAKADGVTKATEAIRAAFAKCKEDGGGTVFVPCGKYLTGPVYLEDNTELNLEAGAELIFSDDISDYKVVTSRWEGVKRECYESCINAYGKTNISITGRGTLNGNGRKWWDIFLDGANEYPRPKLIAPYECEHVLIQGVFLTNSPSWTINTILCNNVTVDTVSIKNPADSPNTDGIDPESCRNVHISNCHIDVGDDCIAIKAGTEDTAERVSCENITITNCTMCHGHGGVVLGSEMSGDVKYVTISNCVFEGTERGIRLKSRRGRGGVIQDIRVNNIIMNKVHCPFIANLYYNCGPKGEEEFVWDKNPRPVTKDTPVYRRLNFSNITCREASASAGFFYGLAEKYVEDCSFEDVFVSMTGDGIADFPAMARGVEPCKQKGFFLSNVKGIRFSNFTIKNVDGPAFELENAEEVVFSNCRIENPVYECEPIVQKNTKNIKILG